MIKVEKIKTWGFEHAIRGMRNPMNSHAKSDSAYAYGDGFKIGENDLELMRKLYKAGAEHRKYMRSIFVSMDITAPLYYWKQMDTYKVGVTMNSSSTMHTIHKKEFTLDDFSHEHMTVYSENHLKATIELLNFYRKEYIQESGSTEYKKRWWWQIIQSLPDSYNQLRTVTMNYENVVNIINQRRGHRLDEWQTFIDIMLDELPYLKEIMQ